MNYTMQDIYPNSRQIRGNSTYYIAKTDDGDRLFITGSDTALFEVIQGDGSKASQASHTYHPVDTENRPPVSVPLSVENSRIIRELFDFTNPVSHKGHKITVGLGDRLGLASPGHIRLIRDLDVFPVLAQQSIRELNLTGRTYDDVLAAAVWAVFREGYTKGYGADGDHLKTHDEVRYALDTGFSMITLDCSEHIRNDLVTATQAEIDSQYAKLPPEITSALEERYLNKKFTIGDRVNIDFTKDDFIRMVLVYLPAVEHALDIFDSLIKGKDIDFEVSIDETLSTTSPQSHFFVANELLRHNVGIASVAPRFPGEFQKGIDYRGGIPDFERDFFIHAKIADHFGYKISVHSGSDKFSVFPIIGRLTGGRYHLKTAGTNWLEAVRVIAVNAPQLYREIHAFALDALPEARKFYHITCDLSNIKDINSVPDIELPGYLDQDDSRQVLHITYGSILQNKKLHDAIYSFLYKHDDEYSAALEKHIGRHLSELGII